jgi:hypothetical protein
MRYTAFSGKMGLLERVWTSNFPLFCDDGHGRCHPECFVGVAALFCITGLKVVTALPNDSRFVSPSTSFSSLPVPAASSSDFHFSQGVRHHRPEFPD